MGESTSLILCEEKNAVLSKGYDTMRTIKEHGNFDLDLIGMQELAIYNLRHFSGSSFIPERLTSAKSE